MDEYIEFVMVILEDIVKDVLKPLNIQYSPLQYGDNDDKHIIFKTEMVLNSPDFFKIIYKLSEQDLNGWVFYYNYVNSNMEFIYYFYNNDIEFHALNYTRNKNLNALLNG